MERKEFRKYVKDKLKAHGFQSQKSYFYKMTDDDYMVVVAVEASSYGKGYQICCGCIYLPDEYKIPLNGRMDLPRYFRFPLEPNGEVDFTFTRPALPVLCYEEYTLDQLDRVFQLNYDQYIVPFHDKRYGLKLYREDWRRMNGLAPENVRKICNLAGLSIQDVQNFFNRPAVDLLKKHPDDFTP